MWPPAICLCVQSAQNYFTLSKNEGDPLWPIWNLTTPPNLACLQLVTIWNLPGQDCSSGILQENWAHRHHALCTTENTGSNYPYDPLMYNICHTHYPLIHMHVAVINSVPFISICCILLFLDPLLFKFLDTFGLMPKIQYYECDILKNIPMF